jgi:redox-sensitive bicupin YhaK (pirin superfamily)
MSGPVRTEDVDPDPPPASDDAVVEVIPSREAQVGEHRVARALPTRGHRTVGAWCFADHMLPSTVPMRVGPHPHIGLQTVTWLVEGALLHTDSLGSEQLIRPGQLNLMTAGRGVAHAEEAPDGAGRGHGIQLWLAQPEATRHGEPAFEHHAELPARDVGGAVATVLTGSFAGVTSPARRDSEHVGVDLLTHGDEVVLALDPGYEHGVVLLDGEVRIGDIAVPPGRLAYLGPGRDELVLRVQHTARLLLLGGPPFGETLQMWWNFVARSRDEIDEARDAWESGDARFGVVRSPLDRIPAPRTPWDRG